MDKIYSIFYDNEPIHKVVFFDTNEKGLVRRRITKKLYTKKGYARNALNLLPNFVERDKLKIRTYILENEKEKPRK